MERKFRVVTKPDNSKADLYRALRYKILNNGLHQITDGAEKLYDERLGIGFRAPILPSMGRGLVYTVDVALEKLLAASAAYTPENILTTDVCWTNGTDVLNKPGDNSDGIEEAIEWWMQQRGAPIGNLGGAALLDATSGTIELLMTKLHLGTVNPLADISDIKYLLQLYGAQLISGGMHFFGAIENGIILVNKIVWERSTYGIFNIADIPTVPTTKKLTTMPPRLIDRGEISTDPSNISSILALLYCVEP